MANENSSQTEAIRRQRALAIVEYLKRHSEGTWPAKRLASHCRIEGSVENQRRRVREAVEVGRDVLSERICANGEGYWLAEGLAEWQRYQAHLRSGAKGTFARIRDRRETATDRCSGQGKLFETRAGIGDRGPGIGDRGLTPDP